jgi:CRP/FNR family transcriptional regulator
MIQSSDFDLNEWLQTTLMFRGLSQSQLIPIVAIAQLKFFSKGEIIFQQGNESTGFFIVKKGRVKIFNLSYQGKEQIIHIIEEKDNFAEVPALDCKPFPASAATLESTELIFFPRLAFLNLLCQHPDICINLLISLSQHLRHLTSIVEELSFKDVTQRLADYLLNLASFETSKQQNNQKNIVVTLDLNKSQLAARLGTIPATLSRSFYRLSSEGLITVEGLQVILLDCDRLQSYQDKAHVL